MFARRCLATLAVAVFSLSAAACSSLTRPDEITIKAEPPPAPAPPPAPEANAAAARPNLGAAAPAAGG